MQRQDKFRITINLSRKYHLFLYIAEQLAELIDWKVSFWLRWDQSRSGKLSFWPIRVLSWTWSRWTQILRKELFILSALRPTIHLPSWLSTDVNLSRIFCLELNTPAAVWRRLIWIIRALHTRICTILRTVFSTRLFLWVFSQWNLCRATLRHILLSSFWSIRK